jgi:hypothetical protein
MTLPSIYWETTESESATLRGEVARQSRPAILVLTVLMVKRHDSAIIKNPASVPRTHLARSEPEYRLTATLSLTAIPAVRVSSRLSLR